MRATPSQERMPVRALMRIAILSVATASPATGLTADPPALDGVTIRLFEQADDTILPVARRLYSTHFDATRMRMLGVEISATYAEPTATTQIPVACTMQRPDGSLEPSDRDMSFMLFEKYGESSSASLLWGVAPEEDWQQGAYRVECAIEGKVIGQAPFEVMLNPSDVANAEIRVAALQLFPVDGDLPARADRKYTTTLPASDTRRIGIELEFTHEPLGRAMVLPVECYYFWPDGQTSPPIVLSYEPQASWPGGYSAGAMGWDEPGNWPQGIYTATCMIHGHPVAVDRFVIE